jgi:hypothetical protein
VRYVHPDHLGSTNVVTDANQNLVQTLDYYPYGGIRISSAASTNEKRKFIGQFSDDTGLDYLKWPAPGSEDTELGVLMELEVGHGETEVYPRVQA